MKLPKKVNGTGKPAAPVAQAKKPATPPPAVVAPVAKVKPAPVAAAKVVQEQGETPAAEAAPARTGRNIGKVTGMRIMQYQDHTLSLQANRKLTDDELASDWQAEFPESRCRFESRPEIIRSVRRLYNEGKHGNQQTHSDEPVLRYGIVNGKRVVIAEEVRGKKVAEVVEEDEAVAS